MAEDEMVGWHHRLNGHEFEQALEDSEGQGSWCAAVHGVTKTWIRLSNWITAADCSLSSLSGMLLCVCQHFSLRSPVEGDLSHFQFRNKINKGAVPSAKSGRPVCTPG